LNKVQLTVSRHRGPNAGERMIWRERFKKRKKLVDLDIKVQEKTVLH